MWGNKKEKKKGSGLWLFWVIIVLAVALKLYSFYWPSTEIKINGQILKVLVAKDYKHLTKGLSGRENLGKYDGMLFVFNNRAQHAMIMRDMKFSIDFIWIDRGVIVDIAPSAPLEPGKQESEYFRYIARDLSTRVLEVPAGTALGRGWKIGDRVEYNP